MLQTSPIKYICVKTDGFLMLMHGRHNARLVWVASLTGRLSVILSISVIQMFCVLSRLASISHRYSYIHESTANVRLAVDTCWCVTFYFYMCSIQKRSDEIRFSTQLKQVSGVDHVSFLLVLVLVMKKNPHCVDNWISYLCILKVLLLLLIFHKTVNISNLYFQQLFQALNLKKKKKKRITLAFGYLMLL